MADTARQPTRAESGRARSPSADRRRRSALVAATLAIGSAAVSAYWTAGGTALLDTVGGPLESLAREHGADAIVLGSVTVLLKAAGAALALVLARRRLPSPYVVSLATVTAVGLIGYGLVNIFGALAGLTGTAGGTVDRTALWGHALLWDPWFVVWGAAMLRAARLASAQRRTTR